jgi:hypothetical protein
VGLVWELTDLKGTVLGEFEDRRSSEVVIGLNAVRTAKVTVSLDEEGSKLAAPLSTRLRAYLDGHPIFNGPVGIPHRSYHEGVIEVNAADPGQQLARRYVKIPSPWQTYGLVLPATDQGQILVALVAHARPSAAELALGIPDHGIAVGSVPATIRRDRSYEPGKQILEAMTELTQVRGGPDFELEPVRASDGTCCLLNVYALQGTDKSRDVVLAYGTEEANCREFSDDPDGFQIANRFTSIGQSDAGNPPPYYTAQQVDSQKLYGIWEGFEGRPDISEPPTFQEHAQESVAAYGVPPTYFDVTPAVNPGQGEDEELGVPPKFGPPSDPDAKYWIGDVIRARAKRGGHETDHRGRVIGATVTEDSTGVQVDLSLSPTAVAGVT